MGIIPILKSNTAKERDHVAENWVELNWEFCMIMNWRDKYMMKKEMLGFESSTDSYVFELQAPNGLSKKMTSSAE